MIAASQFFAPQGNISGSREDSFFAAIQTANGTFKTTGRGRLDDVNELLFAEIGSASARPETLVVHDLGISSGITTVEWLREFERRNFRVSIVASDLSLRAHLVDLGPGIRALIDSRGNILQLEGFGIGIRVWQRRRDLLTGSAIWRGLLLRLARARLLTRAQRAPREILGNPILLLTRALSRTDAISVVEEDVIAPLAPQRVGTADVVRVANLLQHGYFNEDQIRAAVTNIRSRCRGPGSLVVICRNIGRTVTASILELASDQQFRIRAQLGGGSEVESFFLE